MVVSVTQQISESLKLAPDEGLVFVMWDYAK